MVALVGHLAVADPDHGLPPPARRQRESQGGAVDPVAHVPRRDPRRRAAAVREDPGVRHALGTGRMGVPEDVGPGRGGEERFELGLGQRHRPGLVDHHHTAPAPSGSIEDPAVRIRDEPRRSDDAPPAARRRSAGGRGAGHVPVERHVAVEHERRKPSRRRWPRASTTTLDRHRRRRGHRACDQHRERPRVHDEALRQVARRLRRRRERSRRDSARGSDEPALERTARRGPRRSRTAHAARELGEGARPAERGREADELRPVPVLSEPLPGEPLGAVAQLADVEAHPAEEVVDPELLGALDDPWREVLPSVEEVWGQGTHSCVHELMGTHQAPVLAAVEGDPHRATPHVGPGVAASGRAGLDVPARRPGPVPTRPEELWERPGPHRGDSTASTPSASAISSPRAAPNASLAARSGSTDSRNLAKA